MNFFFITTGRHDMHLDKILFQDDNRHGRHEDPDVLVKQRRVLLQAGQTKTGLTVGWSNKDKSYSTTRVKSTYTAQHKYMPLNTGRMPTSTYTNNKY